MKVYAAINAVQRELSHTGIAKDRTNTQGAGYKFRGIDDVYNALAPLLAAHGLCIIPRFISRECTERVSQKGGALFYVTVSAEFDFVSSEDGSKHTACTFGEAMDSGDKATNKAMSAAFKYAAFQTFAIPTEGTPDADAETHQVASAKANTALNMPAGMKASPTDGAGDGLDEAAKAFCVDLAMQLVDMHREQRDIDAIGVWYDATTWPEDVGEKQEQMKYVWHLLKTESKLRGVIKSNSPKAVSA